MKKRKPKAADTHTDRRTDRQSQKLRIIDLTAQWKSTFKIFNNGWKISSSAAIFITELHVVLLHQSQ